MEAGKNFSEKHVLRDRALARMSRAQNGIIKGADPQTRRLLHKLNVHQIELELENKALREAQRQLERSRDRYRQLYDHATVGYIAVNSAGSILQANQTLDLMLGRDRADMLHKPLADLIHESDRDILLARYQAFYRRPAGKKFEIRMLKADGTAIYTELEGRRIDLSADPATPRGRSGNLLISISDITHRKTAEQAIIRAKNQWEQTFDAVSDPIAIIDEKFDIVRVNMALAKRIGVTPQECVGKKCYQVLHARNAPAEECPHLQFNDKRIPVQAEVFNARLNGHFITTITPFNASTREGRRWSIHVFHDISDRKRAERELLKARNLESIGTLAGGIAHDFNNILTGLMGHIDLAKLRIDNPESAGQHLDKSLRACYRARDLANRLLTFAEGGSPHMHTIRISHTIEEIVALSLSGTNVDYRLDLAPDLQPLAIDEAQVKSALQNVIHNAREAMPWGGTVSVKARNVQWATLKGNPICNGAYVRIDISDHGSGIALSHLDKIFDPYFTTKQMGSRKGMGLGLAITHSIVEKHHGHIDVRSKQGEGTTVTIFLPASPDTPPECRFERLSGTHPPVPARKVLFMDDEQILWKVIEQMLRRMDCQVDFAANADEALFLFREALRHDEPYAAVVLDLTIRGGIGGKEVIRQMHSIDPNVKALAVSGYSSDPVFTEFKRFGFIGAIQKPFSLEEFTNRLAMFFDGIGPQDQDDP
jgi:PAS domain S-box-containing protein